VHKSAKHFARDMTLTTQNEKDQKDDHENSGKKEVVFRAYDPWETRFRDEKRRLGTAE